MEKAQAHIAAMFRSAEVLLGEIVERDQWTVTRRLIPTVRSFGSISTTPRGTSLYVSSRTGEIVQESNPARKALGTGWVQSRTGSTITPIRHHQVALASGHHVDVRAGDQRLSLVSGSAWLRIRVRRRYSAGASRPISADEVAPPRRPSPADLSLHLDHERLALGQPIQPAPPP